MTRIVLGVLGLLLGAAAAGKLWLVATDPFADIKLGFPLFVIWLAILCEAGLAYLNLQLVWNLLRRYDLSALSPQPSALSPQPSATNSASLVWLLNVVFFSVLLVISLVRWALGYVSCGCFGVIELPTWVSPLLVAVAVMLAIIVRPSHPVLIRDASYLCFRAPCLLVRPRTCGMAFALAVGLVVCLPHSTALRWSFNRFGWQPRRTVDAMPLNFERLYLNTATRGSILIRNHSSSPARIIGGARSCNCMSDDSIGKVIPPRETLAVHFEVIPTRLGLFKQRLVFYLDHREQMRLVVDVSGIVFSKGDVP